MRYKERIPIFLKYVDINRYLKNLRIFKYDGEIDKLEYEIVNNLSDIQKYWENNYDLRFSEVLSDLDYIPKSFYNHIEDNRYLEKLGVDPLEYTFYDLAYKIKGNKGIKLIKDIDSKTIKYLLQYNFKKWIISSYHTKLFTQVLKERNDYEEINNNITTITSNSW